MCEAMTPEERLFAVIEQNGLSSFCDLISLHDRQPVSSYCLSEEICCTWIPLYFAISLFVFRGFGVKKNLGVLIVLSPSIYFS